MSNISFTLSNNKVPENLVCLVAVDFEELSHVEMRRVGEILSKYDDVWFLSTSGSPSNFPTDTIHRFVGSVDHVYSRFDRYHGMRAMLEALGINPNWIALDKDPSFNFPESVDNHVIKLRSPHWEAQLSNMLFKKHTRIFNPGEQPPDKLFSEFLSYTHIP